MSRTEGGGVAGETSPHNLTHEVQFLCQKINRSHAHAHNSRTHDSRTHM